MKTIEINIFTIEELSEEAKQKAFDEYLGDYNTEWDATYQESMQSLKEFAEMFGCEAYGYDPDRKIARIKYKDELDEIKGKLAHRHINKIHDDLLKNKTYHACRKADGTLIHGCVGTNSIKRTSRLVKRIDCPLTGMCYDMDLTDGLTNYLKRPYKDNESVKDIIVECIENFLSSMQKACEYLNSMEKFVETSKESEHWFYEDGRWCDCA